MCGESARMRSWSSLAGRDQSSSRSAGPIFSAYVASPTWGENDVVGERLVDQRRREASRLLVDVARQSCRRRSEIVRCAPIGPASSSSTSLITETRALLVAGHDRALDRSCSTPARKPRRVDVEPESRGRAGSPGSARRRRRRRSCRRRRTRTTRRDARPDGPECRGAPRPSWREARRPGGHVHAAGRGG